MRRLLRKYMFCEDTNHGVRNYMFCEDTNLGVRRLLKQYMFCVNTNHGVNSVALYPNPTNGIINIRHNFESDNTFTIDLYDNLSRKIKSIQFNARTLETSMDVREFSSGMYYYIVNLGDIEIDKGKITIIK